MKLVVKYLSLMLISFAFYSNLYSQNYEPYVDAATVTPAPLTYPNGRGTLCFNIGNAGDDALVAPGVLPAQRLRLVLTMSKLIPEGNPLTAVSGSWLSYFDYSYDASITTYFFIQKVGVNIPGADAGNICIRTLTSASSPRSNKQNGFNVNLQPPSYTNGIQTTDNDATRIFTFTVTMDAVNDTTTTPFNTQKTGTVATNDTPPTVELPDGPTAGVFSLIGNTGNGNTSMPPNGGYTYTPITGFSGKDSVRYQLCTTVYPAGQGSTGTNGTLVCDTAWLYITVVPPNCVSPVITRITQDTASCWKGVAQADGKVTITVTGADKGDKSTGATYTGPSYGAASNISVSGGSVTFTNLSGGTQYTFRLWNLDNTCYKDTTITTVARTCLPCPTADTLCFGDTLTMTAQAGLTGIVWYKNGVLIAGATGASYDAVVSGEYWYEGKNSSGCVVRPWCPVVLAYKVCGGCGVPQCGTATTVIKKKK